MAELMKNDAEAPLCFESTSALASHTWVSKNLSRSFPSSEVRNSPVKWVDWIDRLLPRYGPHWKRAGIYDAILLSKQSINRDENLLAAALCFWNSASNTFDFRVGPMAPTLLDMAQIFGFRPHGRPVDAVGDYHRSKNQEKLAKPFTISPASINQNCSFSNYLKKFILLEYRHLAEALHNHTDVGLGPTVLAHLFKNLYSATLENPLNLTAPGAFWMIQIWLQVYFPELRFLDVVLPEDQVLAQPLMAAEVPKRSIEEYLMFFRHCTKRSAAQWQVVIRRTYPWFQPGYRLSCNRGSSWRDVDDLEVHKDARCAVNKINNSADALYPSWEPNSCSSAEFDAWWKTRFQGLPASSTVLKVLFDGWDSWAVHAGEETHQFMVQIIKDINAQIIEDPSLTKNIGGQTVQAGEVIVTSVISAGDLELPSVEEEDETLAEPTTVEATSARRKRKETALPQDSMVQLEPTAESPPPPTRSKRLRKRTVVEYVATEDTSAVPTATSGTDDELREAFEEVEKDKVLEELERVGDGPQEKSKTVEEEVEVPVSASVRRGDQPLEASNCCCKCYRISYFLLPFLVRFDRCFLPRMPIHSLAGSSATASFADPGLARIRSYGLRRPVDKLEKLSSPPGRAKSGRWRRLWRDRRSGGLVSRSWVKTGKLLTS
ncbi:unnamed protein product [Prunus brigantina]